ncbi:Ribosomal large subunit pseudouridine synthase D [Caloramator mitchellensis]|uniref:Pseudouridine synthase n=1 Tax=Caloramator mitchellensis TaxID=908809 RepID=A0A0R3JUS4_CALMK|nr:RluA family pseudouridine synthase [Caloramator mitchellensis]KRQ87312.1 Ribosomal large subunit pseudouridine synthase D [Caloramator mitchellensis]
MSKMEFNIEKKDAGKRLDNFLKFEKEFSTRLIKKLTKNDGVLINGKPAWANDVLREGDRVEILIKENKEQDIIPEDIPLNVVYEDEDILVVNKPPFMVVHPTKGHPYGTLANAVMYYFEKTGQRSIVRLVNRLDRDTSGLVIIAKSQFAHQAMAKKFDNNEVEKQYIAIVEGKMEGFGTIDLPIDRPYPDSVKRCVMENGQRAVTHYEVLSSSDEISLVKLTLETGRTHQIRVHLSHIGHPILGDTLYGRESNLINRQALHAFRLKLTKIRNDEEIEIIAKMPDDFKRILEQKNIKYEEVRDE